MVSPFPSSIFQHQNPKSWQDDPAYKNFLTQAEKAFQDIQAEQHQGKLPMLDMAAQEEDLEALLITAQRYRQRFKTWIVLGTGGSSLGAQTLCALKQNAALAGLTSDHRVIFMDNIDPHTFDQLKSCVSFDETGFLVVSKSGTTAETLCQFMTLLSHYETSKWSHHFVVLTEPKSSPLKDFATHYQLDCLDHHQDVGGRFSVLTNAGLLPAALMGIDIRRIRQGAQQIINAPTSAIEGAALTALGLSKGISQSVLMPYIDRLNYFTFWFRQLWAESLGKDGKGSTPLNALGTVDQHSQLQLYLDGPHDKFFTLIVLDVTHQGTKINIPTGSDTDFGLSYLHQKTIGDLMMAEQRASFETLQNRGCPIRLITLSKLEEEELGGLLMHYMLETMLTAKLMQVNAFNQPAVEEGKILTKKFLKDM
ncbi:MAG: hypothetical protein ACRYGR_04400 [Janthinobacterium lividum]